MLKKVYFTVFGVFLCVFSLKAQDPQYSQFYAAPLYISPAFAGSAFAPRLTFNYRNQWPSLNANFITTSFGADMYIDKVNSGVGLLVTSDQQFTNLKTTDLGLQYAYHLKVNEQISMSLGVQGSFVSRSINFKDYVFGDQISNYLSSGVFPSTNDPIVAGGNTAPQLNYMDFSSGALVYTDQFWAGVTVNHINRPNQSFGTSEARLPMKYSVVAGYRIPLADYVIGNNLGDAIEKEKSLTPVINYKHQGESDQLDVGMYLTYSPLVVGVWYRGIPLKKYTKDGASIVSHDALVGLIGYRQDNFSIGYSYDATISTLSGTGGSHEISISYIFNDLFDRKPAPRRNKKELSCPKF